MPSSFWPSGGQAYLITLQIGSYSQKKLLGWGGVGGCLSLSLLQRPLQSLAVG